MGMCSTYQLNKQGDNKQPCCTRFSTWSPILVKLQVGAQPSSHLSSTQLVSKEVSR